MNESWRENAACKGVDPAVFFPEYESHTGPAKRICADCPVSEPCGAYAMSQRHLYGVWAGLSERERDRLWRKRRRAS